MSGLVVGWAFKQKGLSPTQKLVLVALADNAQDDGKAWPGKNTIVSKTELARSSVYRSLDELEEKELLQSGTDERRISCYWLAVPGWDDLSQGGTTCPRVGRLIENPHETSENQPPASPPTITIKSKLAEGISSVWATYVAVIEPRGRGSELQSDDRKIIREALKVGDVEELATAIRACEASDYHMKRGKHKDRPGGRHKSIGSIFKPRTTKGQTWRSRLEWWLERADDDRDKKPEYDVNAEAQRMRCEQGLD